LSQLIIDFTELVMGDISVFITVFGNFCALFLVIISLQMNNYVTFVLNTAIV